MDSSLEEFFANVDIKPRGLAKMIGKTRQTIDNWLDEGGYNIDYDGRTGQVNWITRPGKLVYVRGRERDDD
jgi:hypothetical protein|tara:strand:- start:1 stop:213 length:213 start_codon:yes stop_codon:yes gene_type:complete